MPAETTLPMITSSIESDEIPERRTTSFMTIAPSCGAVKLARLPRNLPVGMRTAPAITGVCSDITSSPLDLDALTPHPQHCECSQTTRYSSKTCGHLWTPHVLFDLSG